MTINTPKTEATMAERVEAAMLKAATEMHAENSASLHVDQDKQVRTYYAGFNLTDLAKRTAAALSRPAPAAEVTGSKQAMQS